MMRNVVLRAHKGCVSLRRGFRAHITLNPCQVTLLRTVRSRFSTFFL